MRDSFEKTSADIKEKEATQGRTPIDSESRSEYVKGEDLKQKLY
jgi:hypothetical protein